MRNALKATLVALLVLAATDAMGATLFKLTDKSGRITYVDAVPKGFDGRIERMEIDTTRPDPGPARRAEARAETEYEKVIRRQVPPDPRLPKIAAAESKLAAAQSALESAQASASPEDWIYMGPGRGRAPRPEYEARLNQLDAAVRAAQEDLKTAERGW